MGGRRLEKRYHSLLQMISHVFFTIDRKGNLLFLSPNVKKVCGYVPEQLCHKGIRPWLEKVHPEDFPRLREARTVFFGGSGSDPVECRIQKEDGQWIWISIRRVDSYGNRAVEYADGVFSDITKTKLLETALRAREKSLGSILRTVPEIVYQLDSKGSITFISGAVTRYGYCTAELLGTNMLEMVHPEDREKARYRINERRTGERSTRALEIRLLPKSSTTPSGPCPTELKGCPFFLVTAQGLYDSETPESTSFLGTQGVAEDISERKRSEEERRNLSSQIQRAQRMEAIGTLAAGIAHDFNNVLTGIQGNASLIMLGTGSNHPHLEKLRNIEKCVQSGVNLTKQLLSLTKGDKLEFTTTDLNRLLRNTCEIFGRAKREILIHMKEEQDLWPVEADQKQIDQVVLNLCINAWQAMPEGGDLHLETKNVTLDEPFARPFGVRGGKYARISVRDTGVGMNEETRGKIFHPFFTTRGDRGGTGLGLATSYRIIKNHGGIIDVQSEEGKGTTFFVYLPASENACKETRKSTKRVVKGKETILLVDDEKMVLEVNRNLICELGYEVLVAENGAEALEIYRKDPDRIDMVILDMVMPGLGGGKVFGRFKEINPSVKVLLSSGYGMNGCAKGLLKRGCRGFIQKPFSLNHLSQTMRQILDA